MSTRIFSVTYDVTELYNGKNKHTFSETRNVVATDALDAIFKVRHKNLKASSFIDDETQKKVKVTRNGFIPTEVTLRAEAE